MNSKNRLFRTAAALLFVTLMSSCTKDKAEAIKTGATRLRDAADVALKQIREILIQNISMPSDDDHAVEKLATELAKGQIDTATLAHVLAERPADPEQIDKIDQELATIQGHYLKFASMFDKLPQGSFLAKNAVKSAEKHAANLAVQMVNFANQIERGKIEVRKNPKRILLQEEINALQGLPDGDAKTEAFKRAARRVVELRREEEDLKQQAIKQCLVAAEAGSAVTQLIRKYNSLTIDEILRLVNQSLGFVSDITGGNADVTRLLAKYQEIENSFRADPYWSKLLDDSITPAVPATPITP